MKLKITLLLFVCFAITSCSKWYYWHKHHDDDNGGGKEERQTVEISDTQIIVRYGPGADKEALRAEFGVGENDYEQCSCGDPNLELWGIDPANLTIEAAIGALRGKQQAEGDFQFTFSVAPVESYETLGAVGQVPTNLASPIFNADEVGIAILDTGIDYGQPYTANPFSTPYLYSTLGLSDCPSSLAGWNFTEPLGGTNVLDDNGHGTFVTKIITSTLDDKGVGYKILPVKVFDGDGQGTYWNVVCAFGYIQKVQDEIGNLNVVNASFGGTIEDQLFDEKGLLNTMINELGDAGVLVVTSAGNEMQDTDGGPLKHFPSGYLADNILAVGGYEIDASSNVVIHPESNYGVQSIDLAASFEGWNVQLSNQPNADLMGTSYSTAYVTALVSEYFIAKGKPGPIELKINFLNDMGTIKISDPLKSYINEGRYVE